jgi:hypothetical protein
MDVAELQTIEGLRRACEHVEQALGESRRAWREEVARYLEKIHGTPSERRSSLEFQKALWLESPIAHQGLGTIFVGRAVEDAGFREWMAGVMDRPIPPTDPERTVQLSALFAEAVDKIKAFCKKRPYWQVFTTFAALFPRDVNAMPSRVRVRRLQRALGIKGRSDWIARHTSIQRRLDEAQGSPGDSWDEVARRMTLPLLLYAQFLQGTEEDEGEEQDGTEGEQQDREGLAGESLKPLPAHRRRRAMLLMKGMLSTVYSTLDFVGEGASREDVLDHLRTISPELHQVFRTRMDG